MQDNLIVTGYVDLHSKETRPVAKNIESYLKHAAPLLNSGKIIYFYCEHEFIDLFNNIIEENNKRKVEFISVDFSSTEKLLCNSIKLPEKRNLGKDTCLYMLLILKKLEWMKLVANEFKDKYFYSWIDLGINHALNLDDNSLKKKLHELVYKENKIIVPRLKKFFFKNKHTDYEILNDFSNCFLAGGIFTAEYKNINWFENMQSDLVKKTIEKYGLLSWETAYWSILYKNNEDKFYTYYSKWNKTLLLNHP